VFLPDDAVVTDDDGALRLHQDLRNPRYSHQISTKSQKAVAASARYRRSIELLTERLASLGFREAPDTPLATVARLRRNSPAERALKLFKEVQFGTPARGTRVTAVVDAPTLAALNAFNLAAGPLWTNQLPPKWTVADGVDGDYVNRSQWEMMRAIAESTSVDALVLTRASSATGGRGKTFRTGGEIEFRWVGTSDVTQPFWEPLDGLTRNDVAFIGGKKLGVPDPTQLGITWRYVAGYDQAKTLEVITALLNNGASRVQFNDPAILQQLSAVQPGFGNDAVIYAKR
jgi:hypothetical protein